MLAMKGKTILNVAKIVNAMKKNGSIASEMVIMQLKMGTANTTVII